MKKETLLMVLGILAAISIGFVIWFQSNNAVVVLPEIKEPTNSTETAATTTLPAQADTTSTIPAKPTPPPQKKPTQSKPTNPTEDCIQAELNAGKTDLDAVFRKCIPGFEP